MNPKLTRKRLINRTTSLLCFSLSRKRFDVSVLAAVKVSLPLTRKFGNLGGNFVRSCLRPVWLAGIWWYDTGRQGITCKWRQDGVKQKQWLHS